MSSARIGWATSTSGAARSTRSPHCWQVALAGGLGWPDGTRAGGDRDRALGEDRCGLGVLRFRVGGRGEERAGCAEADAVLHPVATGDEVEQRRSSRRRRLRDGGAVPVPPASPARPRAGDGGRHRGRVWPSSGSPRPARRRRRRRCRRQVRVPATTSTGAVAGHAVLDPRPRRGAGEQGERRGVRLHVDGTHDHDVQVTASTSRGRMRARRAPAPTTASVTAARVDSASGASSERRQQGVRAATDPETTGALPNGMPATRRPAPLRRWTSPLQPTVASPTGNGDQSPRRSGAPCVSPVPVAARRAASG